MPLLLGPPQTLKRDALRALEKHAFGVIGPKFADNSGDGISDLVIGGHDYYEKTTNVALALFEGGAEMDSALEGCRCDGSVDRLPIVKSSGGCIPW